MTTDPIKALARNLYEAFRNDGGDAWMGDFDDPNNVTLDGSFDFVVIAENLAAIEALKSKEPPSSGMENEHGHRY